MTTTLVPGWKNMAGRGNLHSPLQSRCSSFLRPHTDLKIPTTTYKKPYFLSSVEPGCWHTKAPDIARGASGHRGPSDVPGDARATSVGCAAAWMSGQIHAVWSARTHCEL